jgi:hypothetical protein
MWCLTCNSLRFFILLIPCTSICNLITERALILSIGGCVFHSDCTSEQHLTRKSVHRSALVGLTRTGRYHALLVIMFAVFSLSCWGRYTHWFPTWGMNLLAWQQFGMTIQKSSFWGPQNRTSGKSINYLGVSLKRCILNIWFHSYFVKKYRLYNIWN